MAAAFHIMVKALLSTSAAYHETVLSSSTTTTSTTTTTTTTSLIHSFEAEPRLEHSQVDYSISHRACMNEPRWNAIYSPLGGKTHAGSLLADERLAGSAMSQQHRPQPSRLLRIRGDLPCAQTM
eukprot:1886561-Amphidinium_carterae.1